LPKDKPAPKPQAAKAPGPGTFSLANLQLLARQVMEGLASGFHRSPHQGASVSFKQHRPYVPGDEVRRLDWRAFARTDRFYLREFEQETNLRATLLLDQSGSMAFQGSRSPLSKAAFASQLASTLATLLIQQQDAVGLLSFDAQIRTCLPPRSRPSHLHLLKSALHSLVPRGEGSLSQTLRQVAPRLERRGLLLLLSDCFDEPSALLKALAQLRHQQHEIVVFQIWDRDELEFPFEHCTRFESLETADDQHVIDPAAFRQSYHANLERFRAELASGLQRHRIELFPLRTDEPAEEALARFLRRRTQRR
jgi:uncharacterized protein (DUF58 family)